MAQVNRKIVLRHELSGAPAASDFELTEEALRDPAKGQFRLRHLYIALDPWQRSAMAGRHATGGEARGAGDVPPAEVIGVVDASRHPVHTDGDIVRLMGGWQEYSLSDGTGVQKIDPRGLPPSLFLGALGMPGLTAWASMVRLADVQAGQTVLVSAALGPVGSMVGQIAMQKGASAVGIAGGESKCAAVTDHFGFSTCVNYKADDYPASLQSALPDGADIYHDNVGGQMLIDAISVMKEYGTVVLCGLISQYNDPSQAVDLPVALPIIKRLTLKGLVVYDHAEAEAEFLAEAIPWVAEGRIHYLEDIASGLASAPEQFARLMRGENFGKTLVSLQGAP